MEVGDAGRAAVTLGLSELGGRVTTCWPVEAWPKRRLSNDESRAGPLRSSA